jgi:hypothetical protein
MSFYRLLSRIQTDISLYSPHFFSRNFSQPGQEFEIVIAFPAELGRWPNGPLTLLARFALAVITKQARR